MRIFIVGIPLFLSALTQAENTFDLNQTQADFDAGLYEAVIERLESALNGSNEPQHSLVRSELAYAYLRSGQPNRAILLLEKDYKNPEDLFVLGAAYQAKGQNTKAIKAFENYLSQSNAPLTFKDSAELELGLLLLDSGQTEQAEKHLLSVSFDPDQPELFLAARLPCAKIAFSQGKNTLAEERIQSVADLLPQDHPLMHKYALVRAEMLLQRQEYAQAIPWFEKALPKRNREKAEWTQDALYGLGIAHLHLDFDPQGNLDKALKYLEWLNSEYPSEKAILALGQCYLWRGIRLDDHGAKNHAKELLSNEGYLNTPKALAQALLLRAEAADFLEATEFYEQAIPYFMQASEKDEIAYLHGAAALRGCSKTGNASLNIIQQGIEYAPNGPYAPALFLMLGQHYENQKDFAKAEETYLKTAQNYPKSAQAAEAWFKAALSAEHQKREEDKIKTYRRYVYEQYPNSPFAAEAYFTTYSYQDYVQGDRKAMHHLQGMLGRFPKSPYTLNALYLLGIDYLRDRKTPEGRWVRKKSLTSAIDHFNKVESLFSELYSKNQIPSATLTYYTYLRDRSILERALANLTIADESTGAKRQIYLDYAVDVFQKIIQNPDNQVNNNIIEEAQYGLAQAYLKAKKEKFAEAVLDGMLAQYNAMNVHKGYYLSRVWYEKGC